MAARVIAPLPHGGRANVELDLSVNLNPLGTPDRVKRAIKDADFGTYQSLDRRAAVARLAVDSGSEPERIVVTAGATEGLRLALEVLLPPGGLALVTGPTYGEYRRVARLRGAQVLEVRARPPEFRVPVERLLAAVRRRRPDVVVLCNPNNPTGRALASNEAAALVEGLGDARLVVDESFAPFAGPHTPFGASQVAITFLRSLTKLHAIPGVRIGYLHTDRVTARAIEARQDPWTVGSHALAAAASGGWFLSEQDRAAISRLRADLGDGLRQLGLSVRQSDVNFVLAHVPDALRLHKGLLARGIAVRGCADFGLREHLRMAVPDDHGRSRLLEAIAALAGPGGFTGARNGVAGMVSA